MNASLLSSDPKRRVLTLASWALLIASPFLLIAALSVVIGKNAFFGNPVWTDELDYWRSVFSFINVGGNTGYSGIGELTAKMGTLGVHGLTPLLLYGGYASVFGWTFSSIVLCNCLWVSAGALAFCALNRPQAKTALFMTAAFMAYAPVVLYCYSSMTELANYGLLLFYLAFLTRLARVRRAEAARNPGTEVSARTGLPSLVLAALTVVFCCAYRITYLGLFIPLVIIACDGRWSGRMLLGFLAAILVSLFIYYLTALCASPFASGFLYNFLRTGSLRLSAKMFLSHAKANLYDYFVRPLTNSMESSQRWLYCGTALLCLIGSFVRVNQAEGRLRISFHLNWYMLLCFVTLFLPFAIVICAYETNDWSDYRTLAPFLWLVVTALLVRGRKLIPMMFLAGCAVILVLLATGSPVGIFADTGRFDPAPYTEDAQALYSVVEYDPQAKNPFANTVRTDLFDLETVSTLNPGLGIESGWFTEDSVGKSRWLLTDHLKIPLEGYELAFKNKSGSVYRLTDAYEQQ